MGKRRNRKKKKRSTASLAAPQAAKRDFTALYLAGVSCFLIWLSLPGRDLDSLAWISFAPLAWLIHCRICPHKVYRQVWVVSSLFWLVTLHFVRIPHWALWFGWLLLTSYLSVYLPLLVWLGRIAVHRFRVPTAIAVPVLYTGLEWIRVNFLTGFGIACVSHSQYRNPASMQIAEYFGAYGVTFAIVFVGSAVGVATAFVKKLNPNLPTLSVRILHGCLALLTIASVLGFGTNQLAHDAKLRNSSEAHKHLRVALIQSSNDTIIKSRTPDERQQQREEEFAKIRDQTHSARLVAEKLDLVVWPESSLEYADFLSDVSATDTVQSRAEIQRMAWQAAIGMHAPFSDAVPMLVGSTTLNPEKDEVFNSALLFDNKGEVTGRYYKNHLVMFGEYFPIVHWIPVIKNIAKGFRSLNAGTEAVSMNVNDVIIAPTICFETTVPQYLRSQINSIEAQGEAIDAIVNVTNDGWFFGTSCLDLHFACNTMRAIEMRKPVLVAANTGFSAHIDEFGRHAQVGPRREEAQLICDVRIPTAKVTVYRKWGAWVACVFGWLAVGVAVFEKLRPPRNSNEGNQGGVPEESGYAR